MKGDFEGSAQLGSPRPPSPASRVPWAAVGHLPQGRGRPLPGSRRRRHAAARPPSASLARGDGARRGPNGRGGACSALRCRATPQAGGRWRAARAWPSWCWRVRRLRGAGGGGGARNVWKNPQKFWVGRVLTSPCHHICLWACGWCFHRQGKLPLLCQSGAPG